MLTRFQTQSRDLQLLQSSWAATLDPFLANPFLQGILLPNITLINGVTVINHMLGRNLQGWVLTDLTAAATIYRSAALNDKTLTLTSNLQTRCSIYAF